MQRFWMQSFPDPGRRQIKWRPADRVGYETSPAVQWMLCTMYVFAESNSVVGCTGVHCQAPEFHVIT